MSVQAAVSFTQFVPELSEIQAELDEITWVLYPSFDAEV